MKRFLALLAVLTLAFSLSLPGLAEAKTRKHAPRSKKAQVHKKQPRKAVHSKAKKSSAMPMNGSPEQNGITN